MLLPLLLGAASLGSVGPETSVYIGTYTSPEGSKGIYRLKLNVETGALSQPELAAETVAPSYAAMSPDGKVLYAVNEFSQGEASAFAVEPGGLRKLNTVKFQGGGPCHLSVHPSGKFVFVAAYGGGTVAVLAVKADGSLGEATDVFQNKGSGTNPRRQEAPHMHFVTPDESGKFVYACDLGTDEVLAFSFDSESGKLRFGDGLKGKVPPGAGARHMTLRQGGGTVYVNNELMPGVTVFARDKRTGALTQAQVIASVPENEPIDGRSTAGISLHPNGKWLYVSNRRHDTIAVFQVERNGHLKLVEIAPAQVREPRGFGIDPSGKWLITAGQNSDDLTTLRIDPKTGRLSPTGHRVSVSKPVCVIFGS